MILAVELISFISLIIIYLFVYNCLYTNIISWEPNAVKSDGHLCTVESEKLKFGS